MRGLTVLISILLLPASLALPSIHGQGHKHFYKRENAYESRRPSGAQPTGLAPGPYNIGNGTSGVAGTGTGLVTLTGITGTSYVTIQSTIYQTVAGAPADSASQAAATGGATFGSGNESADTCGGTVTVTYAPTITVTVTGITVPAESAAIISTSSATVEAGAPPMASSITPEAVPSGPTSTAQSLAQAETAAPIPENTVPAQVYSTSTLGSTPTEASTVTAVPAEAATTAAATPSVVTSTTASAAQGGSTTGTAGSKRGVIIPAGGADQLSLVTAFNDSEKIIWVGNWYSSGPPNLNPRIDFVPQNYGKDSDTSGEWTKNAQKAEAEGQKYFLSFGEPGTPNAELYMDAQDAANLWMKEMQPYAKAGISVGAPGNLQNTQDFTYLSQFLDACDSLGCDIGFIAVHWFYVAAAGNEQGFKDCVNNATKIANGKPVWVDNFQATGTNEAQQAFLGDIVPWLEQNEAVQRYAYVTPNSSTGTGFLNADGSISSLGTFYANL
ncbi:hypothetical protein P7C71_g2557, partial [Lecanoromycetidae sp. Uapishka_2]